MCWREGLLLDQEQENTDNKTMFAPNKDEDLEKSLRGKESFSARELFACCIGERSHGWTPPLSLIYSPASRWKAQHKEDLCWRSFIGDYAISVWDKVCVKDSAFKKKTNSITD